MLNLDVPGQMILDEGDVMQEVAKAGIGLVYVTLDGVAAHIASGRCHVV